MTGLPRIASRGRPLSRSARGNCLVRGTEEGHGYSPTNADLRDDALGSCVPKEPPVRDLGPLGRILRPRRPWICEAFHDVTIRSRAARQRCVMTILECPGARSYTARRLLARQRRSVYHAA